MKAFLIRQPLKATTACELRRNRPARILLMAAALLFAAAANPQGQSMAHEPALRIARLQPEPAPRTTAPSDEPHGPEHPATAEGEHAAEEHGGLSGLLWPLANFLVLCGGLYYFLRTPFTEYLRGRSSQIRKDLLDAAELNRTATEQLADVDRKMQALPGEIAALRTRGAHEIAAEEERIASAAAADRARLLTQARREIEVRLQSAQRELSDHAANLALDLARQRLTREMTPADHARLAERYVQQVKER
jgi:F0F1-type ATP synthase membrane subunit b/b'